MIESKYTISIPLSNNYRYLFSCLTGRSIIIDENEDINPKRLLHDYYFTNDIVKDYDSDYHTLINKLSTNMSLTRPVYVILFSYKCNLKCVYCYEYKVADDKSCIKTNMLGNISRFIDKTNPSNKYQPLFILMGGEPLLPENYDLIKNMLPIINNYNGEIQIITNGTYLDHYESLLRKTHISLQVTLDGLTDINSARRKLANQNKTQVDIFSNVYKYLNDGHKIIIRTNVDKHNINNIAEFADYYEQKYGSYDNIEMYFYPISEGTAEWDKYLYKNEYDYCIDMCNVANCYPNLLKYNWSLHGCNHVYSFFNNNIPDMPLLSFCDVSQNQFVFAPDGDVYKCWFGVSNNVFNVGKYHPDLNINFERLRYWCKRNINDIHKCHECVYALICGGACAYKALSKNGNPFEPTCPPIKDLINLYANTFWRLYSNGK